MKRIVLSVFLALVALVGTGWADKLPVDDSIQELFTKASQLEDIKAFYLKNRCEITVGSNKIPLEVIALRSQGLVIGIADGSPGKYSAFSNAPKPQILENVLTRNLGNGTGPWIVSSQLGYTQGEKEPTHLVVNVNWPVYDSGLDLYRKVVFGGPLPTPDKKISVKKSTPGGVPLTLNCN